MTDQDQVKDDTQHHGTTIREVVAYIGFNADGILAVEAPGVDPAALSVMLGQMHDAVVRAISYRQERKVVPISGGRIPHLSGNGRH